MKPIHTIAVGFDGSENSKVAVRWALSLALHCDARVVVTHAVGLLGRFDAKSVTSGLEASLLELCDECGFELRRPREPETVPGKLEESKPLTPREIAHITREVHQVAREIGAGEDWLKRTLTTALGLSL